MGIYFLDTSALVKRYVTEPGSNWVILHCKPDAGHTIIISQATLVEAVAALCSKVRTTDVRQRISEADRDYNISLFRQDVQRQYNIVQVNSATYTSAGDLCRVHKLRAYDAIQLACVLYVRTTLAPLGIAPTFISSDSELLKIAQVEGLGIGNPTNESSF